MKLTHKEIRAAGGIVNTDGSILFTSVQKLNAALRAKVESMVASEPVAWMYSPSKVFEGTVATLEKEDAKLAESYGIKVTPLFTAPQPPNARHVGDSQFESWFSTYDMANKGTKQQMRDAYAEGMSDWTDSPQPLKAARPLSDEQIDAITDFNNRGMHHVPHSSLRVYARAIEAAHNIKEVP